MENVEILLVIAFIVRAVLVLFFFIFVLVLFFFIFFTFFFVGSTLLVEREALIRILIPFVVDIVEFVEHFVFYDLKITSVLHAEISDL